MKIAEKLELLSETDNIYIRIVTDHGMITDFVIAQVSEFGEEKCQVVRYDTAHGYAHKDCLYLSEKVKELLPDRPFDELFEMCVREVKSEWKNYRSQYMRNRWGTRL
jgi:hypothetical protein